MEYRINKIDTDLRNRINEERSEDKVHNKKGINVNKDKNKEENNEKMEKKHEHKKDAAESQMSDNGVEEKGDPNRGHFIDIRR